MSEDEYAVDVSGVTKQYGDFLAVDDLSFRVPKGTIYGVLGPNGAGKSTTLRMINDIILPDKGNIKLLGELSPGHEAAKRIGYLPEERGLYPKMKVRQVLAFFGELRGLRRRVALKQADTWLERLKISDWKDNKVQDLSKGMQQKVQFAASLIHDPELLILDEPWSGLDPINAEVLKEIVLSQKEAGRTILFSTHLMDQAEQICESVCIIARGRKAVEGKLSDLKQDFEKESVILLSFVSKAEEAKIFDTSISKEFFETFTRSSSGVEVLLKSGKSSAELFFTLATNKVHLQKFERKQATLHQIFVSKVGSQADNEIACRSVKEATRG